MTTKSHIRARTWKKKAKLKKRKKLGSAKETEINKKII